MLDGEIRSKVYSRKDRREPFIFGDASVAASGEDIQNMDYYVFHQANAFINNHIAKKLKQDKERIPWTIKKYGNTSSISVPLTFVSELKDKMEGEKKIMMSALGVDMT